MAEAFARKMYGGANGSMYTYIGSRQSPFDRVTQTLYRNTNGGTYNPDYTLFESMTNSDVINYGLWDGPNGFLVRLMLTDGTAAWSHTLPDLPYEWGNLISSNPLWFTTWISKDAPIGLGVHEVVDIYGREAGNPSIGYILTPNQQNALCGDQSCIKITDGNSQQPDWMEP